MSTYNEGVIVGEAIIGNLASTGNDSNDAVAQALACASNQSMSMYTGTLQGCLLIKLVQVC